jgi:hypothetical protein
VVHPVVIYFLCIIRKTRHGQESYPVIGGVVGGPGGDLISELHLSAYNKAVPRNHLVEMAGFNGHVMKLRLDHRAYFPFAAWVRSYFKIASPPHSHKSDNTSASLSGIDRNGEWLAGKLRTSTGGHLAIITPADAIERAARSLSQIRKRHFAFSHPNTPLRLSVS